MSINEKLISLEPGARVNLYEINATMLGGGISRFTDASIDVAFNEQLYVATQVETSGWEMTTKGSLPRPVMKITNVNKLGTALVIAYNDMKGAIVTRKRTLARYLDTGVEPNPGAIINPIDVYIVDQKLTHNKQQISWQLVSPNDQEEVKLPYRQVFRTCQFSYRVYDGEDPDDPFDYTDITCPYAEQNYFEPDGTPTPDPEKDKCGRRLSDCRLRFGQTSVIPFGGFPGVARVRN